jgi:type VI secretion system secreted protein Hcp
MAGNIYLDMGTIKGSASIKAFTGNIPIDSFSYGSSNPVGPGIVYGRRSMGKAESSEMNFSKESDISTAALYRACLKGTVIPKAILKIGTLTGDPKQWTDVAVYTLENVLVTSISTSASSDIPHDSFSIAYSKINLVFDQQATDTKAAGKNDYEYDISGGVAASKSK